MILSFAQRHRQINKDGNMMTANTRKDGSTLLMLLLITIICGSLSRSLPLNKARPGMVPIMGLPGDALLPMKCMAN